MENFQAVQFIYILYFLHLSWRIIIPQRIITFTFIHTLQCDQAMTVQAKIGSQLKHSFANRMPPESCGKM